MNIPENMLHWNPEEESHVDDEADVHEDEADHGDELDEHQPPGCHPLPDLSVLVAPDWVTARVQPVKLLVGMTVAIKAECPEAHVEELLVRPGVLP